jgi:hypothetical protein
MGNLAVHPLETPQQYLPFLFLHAGHARFLLPCGE